VCVCLSSLCDGELVLVRGVKCCEWTCCLQATALVAANLKPADHHDVQVIWQLVLPEGNPALVPYQPNPSVLRDLNVSYSSQSFRRCLSVACIPDVA
jgi:hypothetical protein